MYSVSITISRRCSGQEGSLQTWIGCRLCTHQELEQLQIDMFSLMKRTWHERLQHTHPGATGGEPLQMSHRWLRNWHGASNLAEGPPSLCLLATGMSGSC